MAQHQHPLFHFGFLALVLSAKSWLQSVAFGPRAITPRPHRFTNRPHPLSALPDKFNNHDTFAQSDFQQADSITRRRLVFSLLATSSILPPSALAAVNSPPSTSSSTTITDKSETIRVLRPPLDKRQYETYTLPNGLKVLLCSDPTSTAAAVGMNVHVGACSDPVEIPGLVCANYVPL